MKEHAQEKAACVALRTQYRMNQWISHFASRVFYDGTLLAAPTVAKRVLKYSVQAQHVGAQFIAPTVTSAAITPIAAPVPYVALAAMAPTVTPTTLTPEAAWLTQTLRPEYPLVFVNVSSENEHDGLKISNAEARTVRDVVQGLLKRGIAESDIGIIAPYRAQVANIRRHLFSDNEQTGWYALSSATSMSIDTVDRFRGVNAPSLSCRSPPHRPLMRTVPDASFSLTPTDSTWRSPAPSASSLW